MYHTVTLKSHPKDCKSPRHSRVECKIAVRRNLHFLSCCGKFGLDPIISDEDFIFS